MREKRETVMASLGETELLGLSVLPGLTLGDDEVERHVDDLVGSRLKLRSDDERNDTAHEKNGDTVLLERCVLVRRLTGEASGDEADDRRSELLRYEAGLGFHKNLLEFVVGSHYRS